MCWRRRVFLGDAVGREIWRGFLFGRPALVVGAGRMGDEMYEHGAARLCERINQGRCWQIYRRDKVSRNRCFLHSPRNLDAALSR